MRHAWLSLTVMVILLSSILLVNNYNGNFANGQLGGLIGGIEEAFVPKFEKGVKCLGEQVEGILFTGKIGDIGLDRHTSLSSEGASSECGCVEEGIMGSIPFSGGVYERPVDIPVAGKLGGKHLLVKDIKTGESAGFQKTGSVVLPEPYHNEEVYRLILPLTADEIKCVMDAMHKNCSDYNLFTNNCQHCAISGLDACGILHNLEPGLFSPLPKPTSPVPPGTLMHRTTLP